MTSTSNRDIQKFFDDELLIPITTPGPVISDPIHGYFGELLLPIDDFQQADLAIIGFPIDIGASYRMIPGGRPSGGSPSEGAIGIRRGLGYCRTYGFALEVDFRTDITVVDVGNVLIRNTDGYDEAFGKLAEVLKFVLDSGVTPIVLGGDNSTTYMTMKTLGEHYDGKIGLIWLDAHTDTSDSYRGDRFWCGSPMARILELPREHVDPRNIAMVGIRGFDLSRQMVDVALDAGVTIFPAEFVHERGILPVAEEIFNIVTADTAAFYVMWDPDAMEAAFAPGHAIPTTGGLYPHHLKQLLRLAGLCGAAGLEVVEVAPGLDVRDATVRLASESVLEFVSGIARRKRERPESLAHALDLVRNSWRPRRRDGVREH